MAGNRIAAEFYKRLPNKGKLLKGAIFVCCLNLAGLIFWDGETKSDTKVMRTFYVSNQTRAKQIFKPIGFLKVHKAASTTIQNIFLRYGHSKNRTFVLPTRKLPPRYSHVISLYKPLAQGDIEPAPHGKSFEILCHHTIYDAKKWKDVLGSDIITIGSVRDPVSHFRSILNYFQPNYIKRIGSASRIGVYLESPNYFEIPIPMSVTNNRMSFEFGASESIIWRRDLQGFSKYLNEVLDKEFDLVIVMERFDESLVLMRRKMNWTLIDIVYIKVNANAIQNSEWYLDDSLIPLLKSHNILDFTLYDFFNKRLDKQIKEEQNNNFDAEVNTFKVLCEAVKAFCLYDRRTKHSITLNESLWNEKFVLDSSGCEIMMIEEIFFTEVIRQKQRN